MMDGGLPEQKRPRLVGPSPGSWQTSPETSRQLPPPPPGPLPPPAPPNHASSPYGPPQHPSPFSRPDAPSHPHPPHPLDRRQSEHAQYDHPDSRRPSSGPPHGYIPPHSAPPQYVGRPEPMIKRDPSDEPQQPQYRPPSTGAGHDHNVNHQPPPPNHEGLPRQHYLPPFEAPHSRPPYSPYPPHVQSPMSATEPYPYGPPSIQPPPREQYPSVSYPQSRGDSNGPKKKATRAAQACDSCRSLKAKCDEGRPSCTTCKDKQMECKYRDPPPKQQDKTSADILDFLMRIDGRLQELSGTVAHLETVVAASLQSADAHLKLEHSESAVPAVPEYPRPAAASGGQEIIDEPMSGVSDAIMELPQPQEEDEDDADPGPARDPTIPVNHTTGASRLLLQPAVRELVGPLLADPSIKNERYPMVQETKRGLLRLFGRGEGNEILPGYDKDPLIDHGADTTPGDTNSPAASPAGEEWGQLGGLTPPGNPPPDIQRGAINGEGMPDLSREVVYDLVRSYKENMNNMHPILVPSQLDALIEAFLKAIPESQIKSKQISAIGPHQGVGFIGTTTYRNPESPGNKRKRSPVSGDLSDPPNLLDHKPGHPFRSIGSAIVLLVLALGKICKYEGKLPDVLVEREPPTSYGSSPTIRNGHPPSPLQGSPMMLTPMAGSPYDTDRSQPRSRRTSLEGQFLPRGFPPGKARNLDVIPGLPYFALATDIIGNQLAGNTLQHVHANILAGLYHAQLARVSESQAYIANACRSLQIILRPKLDRFRKLKEANETPPYKDNPLIFAFWTCLQLESDIVAELPFPQSGILTFEEDMPIPNLELAEKTDKIPPEILRSYSAQLYIRKHLNQLHNMFYKPETEPPGTRSIFGKDNQPFKSIQACEDNLEAIAAFAPEPWNQEEGDQATDILGARFRAKYYGARVITYRHFILELLKAGSTGKNESSEQDPSEPYKTDIEEVPSINKQATCLEDIDPKVIEYARRGLRALVHSTEAFHGLGEPAKHRLNVTNIWGTAHAQWGNMLTLQAVYQSPLLKSVLMEIVTKEKLSILLVKTISFLKLIATPSSALAIDCRILQYTGQVTGLLSSSSNASSSYTNP